MIRFCVTVMLFLITASSGMAGMHHYTDENGVRNFPYVPPATHAHPGDPRLSKKANDAIMALKDYNECLKQKNKRSSLYKRVIIETGKWLESEEARWSELAAMEIMAALTDYENYESLMFRKINGFGEGREGRIDHEGVLWVQFIETYPAASYDVDHNLEAMMIHVLQSAVEHTNMAVMYMIDIAHALKDRR